MNVRKPTDYTALFLALDTLMAEDLPQMELYCDIGRLVSDSPEKGAAVPAVEYLQSAYLDSSRFSPRNLRRMREFYSSYIDGGGHDYRLDTECGYPGGRVDDSGERLVYSGCLSVWMVQARTDKKVVSAAHLEIVLDLGDEVCYTGETWQKRRHRA